MIDSEKGDPRDVRIWERLTDKDLLRLRCGQGGCLFSADGSRLAAVLPNGEIRSYNTKTWEVVAKINIEAKLWDKTSVLLATSPDGKQVAFRTKGNCVAAWDMVKDRQVARFEGRPWNSSDSLHPGDFAKSAAYSPDGKMLAVVTGLPLGEHGEDFVGRGELHLWDLTTGKRLFQDQVNGSLWSVAFSPDGQLVAAGGVKETAIWNLAEKKLVANLHLGVNGVWFSAKGDILITASNSARLTLWNASTGKVHSTLLTGVDYGDSVQISANTRLLLIQRGQKIFLWDLSLP